MISTIEMIIGIILIVMAVFLVIAVLMQSSKDHRMGASIAGGAETFFGKQKGKTMDALFNKLTTVIAIVFVILVLTVYFIQPDPSVVTFQFSKDLSFPTNQTIGEKIDEGFVDAINALVGEGQVVTGWKDADGKLFDFKKDNVPKKEFTLYAVTEKVEIEDNTEETNTEETETEETKSEETETEETNTEVEETGNGTEA